MIMTSIALKNYGDSDTLATCSIFTQLNVHPPFPALRHVWPYCVRW